ncbi:MAG: fatty acid desaturase [Meiothermus sp.]|uniref:fatty acid desaturase family protein n=1 Tax=Meiothermus sp. TaxID=1955249 RepID=UPI0025E95016|nr:fatty acid desaturase [Meiothermus sp.]MCS7058423.1 fatty acid desaturase [Meiothermus sp.]MCS7195471.1 fatty acid desaturase [Meiothermus sp.]MCX7741280.1 fatty acid desaturase [Meiothermus sp.]MDW8089789.1 fatty acid desaturase [Meiothermus sp.]MDW8481785.1 fatty acid desaturase [Meiothermus sp.]
MRQEQHLREYTRTLKTQLPRHFFEPVPARMTYLPALLILFGLCTWGILATSRLELKLLLSLGIGYAFVGMGFLAHEILHGAITKNPRVRSITGTIAFLPLMVGARLWRRWHNVEHHGHTQHPEDDPDTMGALEGAAQKPFLRWLFRQAPALRSFLLFFSFTFWFTLHAQMMLRRFWPEFKPAERPAVVFQALLPPLLWTGVLLWVGPSEFLFIYLIPWMLANAVAMGFIATNHLLNPLTQTNDPLLNSLTVRNPPLVEWLTLGFGYHTEHHIFPALSPKYAPRVAQKLRALWPERYNELPHWKALLYLWKTPRLYRDHRNLIEPTTGRVFGTIGFGLSEEKLWPKP